MKKKNEKTELEKRLEAEMEAEAAAQGDNLEEEDSAQAPVVEVSSEELAGRIEELEGERNSLFDQLLRARAEFDNYRKRIARDAELARQRAAENLIRDLLPVVDHLELALQHAESDPGSLGEGVRMVLRQFHDVLRKHGVEPIAAVGEDFDPNVHEAIMRVESEDTPEDKVTQEFQRGYRLGGQMLRPSKVVVSGGAPRDGADLAEFSEED